MARIGKMRQLKQKRSSKKGKQLHSLYAVPKSFKLWLVGGFACLLAIALHLCMIPPLYAVSPDAFSVSLSTARSLNLQGNEQLERGNPQAALGLWQQAEQQYRHAGDDLGVWGSQVNQAKALQALGFYRRAQSLLEPVVQQLEAQPDSALKLTTLLSLGDVLRLLGNLADAQGMLQTSLEMAQRLQLPAYIQAAHLYLGNTLVAQQNPAAINHYHQAAAIEGPLQITAQLRELALLPASDSSSQSVQLAAQIATQLSSLPASAVSIYGRIELAKWLIQFPGTTPLSIADLLTTATQQAQVLGDRRAESYAIGYLGHWYEQQQQWDTAQQSTQTALAIANEMDAPDVAYQWQWQLGRIFIAQNQQAEAVTAYAMAVDSLQSIRQDLVAVAQDVQFSFRSQVEPVYRELVDLLLSPHSPAPRSSAQLAQARQTIEALQLAEINNFFREACLETELAAIDTLDPTAAILYPIILPDCLEVILALPGQPLRHYTTLLPQTEIEAGIQRMLQSMRSTSFAAERLPVAQELYQWLVQPAAAELEQAGIQTLVFVLDGSLRNLPMAALHDGTQYLIEQYRVAVAPSSQLVRAVAKPQKQKVLVGGLSEAVENLVPLPGVMQEILQIQQEMPTEVLLNQQFTPTALKTKAKHRPFTILHLATHGQFGSTAEETFVQTWDGRLTVKDLQTLLKQQEDLQGMPIDLLVLSACQTAQGDNQAALGMAGVALRSGAASTLATLWTVNDQSTADFMTLFYATLNQPGMTKAEAVRQAQLHLIHQTRYQHPFYWAPFILVGDWL